SRNQPADDQPPPQKARGRRPADQRATRQMGSLFSHTGGLRRSAPLPGPDLTDATLRRLSEPVATRLGPSIATKSSPERPPGLRALPVLECVDPVLELSGVNQ